MRNARPILLLVNMCFSTIGICMLGLAAGGSCKAEPPGPPTPTVVKADPGYLTYVRDERVGLCFARYRYEIPCPACPSTNGYSIAPVDCAKLVGVAAAPVEELR